MRILVTNDDGIDSPGVWALAEAMSHVGETLLVAPDAQRSGSGTSVTMRSDMSIVEVPSATQGIRAYAVGGTPTDCVILGLWRLAQGDIDLIVSGINLGGNMGTDILYSGTVMATLQGFYREIPSMAVSLAIKGQVPELRFDVASKVAEMLALNMTNGTMPGQGILNVNVPSIPSELVKGIAVTTAASSSYVRLVAGQQDGRHSWSPQAAAEMGIHEGTDIWAVFEDWISLTPLRPAVTDHDSIPALAEHVSTLQSDLQRAVLGGTE